MTISEPLRTSLFTKLASNLGTDEAAAVMNHLLPVEIDEIATKTWVDLRLSRTEASLTGRMQELDQRLTGRMDLLEASLTGRMQELDQRLTGRMQELDQRLTGRMDLLEASLDAKIDRAITRLIFWLVPLLLTTNAALLAAFKTLS